VAKPDIDFADRYRVRPGAKVELRDAAADDTGGVQDKPQTKKLLRRHAKRMADLQYLLYAENRRALLVILQAMDAGGKDGTIRRVMGPLNPQSCRVTSFKAPTEEELAHDFLWRIHRAVPRRGEIGIFNRSHYEDVLIVRVRSLVPKSVWSRRYEQINAFEKILSANDVHILKFFLHISKDEQLRRLKKRLSAPNKQWKANQQDFEERKRWDDYITAYEEAIRRCSTEWAPWYVIPADQKWFRNLAVMQIVVEKLKGLRMKFPKPAFDVSTVRPK